MDYNLPFLKKLNFASSQNGGFAQNGHKKKSQNEKNSSTVFSHFQHKQYAKEILRKISLEQKLQLIEN
jgi:hypothetical protein